MQKPNNIYIKIRGETLQRNRRKGGCLRQHEIMYMKAFIFSDTDSILMHLAQYLS